MATEIQKQCETIEECYEFTLSFAARGLASDEGSELRRQLTRAVAAMRGLEQSCAESIVEERLAAPDRNKADKFEAFFAVLQRDAESALAAMELVLAQPTIGSQLIDNLNASIHLRALLADLFLVTEILDARQKTAAQETVSWIFCQAIQNEDLRSIEGLIGGIIVLWLPRERIEGQHPAMEKLTLSFSFFAVVLSTSAAQVVAPFPHRVQLDSKIANTLLVHKEEPACQKDPDGIRVTGTVVIAITIDKGGHVTHAETLTGPKMLRPLALTTVRKYLYKPYLLNGTPVEVETTVSIRIECIFHSGQA